MNRHRRFKAKRKRAEKKAARAGILASVRRVKEELERDPTTNRVINIEAPRPMVAWATKLVRRAYNQARESRGAKPAAGFDVRL